MKALVNHCYRSQTSNSLQNTARNKRYFTLDSMVTATHSEMRYGEMGFHLGRC